MSIKYRIPTVSREELKIRLKEEINERSEDLIEAIDDEVRWIVRNYLDEDGFEMTAEQEDDLLDAVQPYAIKTLIKELKERGY
ncbi:MAG: hypothetical protein ACOC5G_04090 [Acidobacteriota bacterium]